MCCPAPFSLWKSFRRSRTRFRDRPETVRLHRGIGVRLHPGTLFAIIPECRSASSRNRVHLAPDSPDPREVLALTSSSHHKAPANLTSSIQKEDALCITSSCVSGKDCSAKQYMQYQGSRQKNAFDPCTPEQNSGPLRKRTTIPKTLATCQAPRLDLYPTTNETTSSSATSVVELFSVRDLFLRLSFAF